MPKHSRLKRGFTLIELSFVIAIIAVLDVAIGQSAKLNVAFLPAVQLPAVQCTLDLKIYDNMGNVVASGIQTLLANQSKSITFNNAASGTSPTAGDPTAVEFHASVEIPACPDNSTTCSKQEREVQSICLEHRNEFSSSLELIDANGKTVTALSGIATLIGSSPGTQQ